MVVLLTLVPAQAAPLAEQLLEEATVLHQEAEFAQCIQRLSMAAAEGPSRSTLLAIELLSGICHHNLGKTDEAKRHFRIALKMDATASLPVACSPKTRALFAEVLKGLEEADAGLKWESDSNRPAQPMVQVERLSSTDAGTLAAQDFKGVELKARPPWRWFSIPTSVVALGAWATAVGFGLEAKRLEKASALEYFESSHLQIGADAMRAANRSNLFSAIAGGFTLASAILWYLWVSS